MSYEQQNTRGDGHPETAMIVFFVFLFSILFQAGCARSSKDSQTADTPETRAHGNKTHLSGDEKGASENDASDQIKLNAGLRKQGGTPPTNDACLQNPECRFRRFLEEYGKQVAARSHRFLAAHTKFPLAFKKMVSENRGTSPTYQKIVLRRPKDIVTREVIVGVVGVDPKYRSTKDLKISRRSNMWTVDTMKGQFRIKLVFRKLGAGKSWRLVKISH